MGSSSSKHNHILNVNDFLVLEYANKKYNQSEFDLKAAAWGATDALLNGINAVVSFFEKLSLIGSILGVLTYFFSFF